MYRCTLIMLYISHKWPRYETPVGFGSHPRTIFNIHFGMISVLCHIYFLNLLSCWSAICFFSMHLDGTLSFRSVCTFLFVCDDFCYLVESSHFPTIIACVSEVIQGLQKQYGHSPSVRVCAMWYSGGGVPSACDGWPDTVPESELEPSVPSVCVYVVCCSVAGPVIFTKSQL